MGSPGKPPTTSPVNLENTKESALVKSELVQVTPGDLPAPQMLPFLLSGQAVSRYSIYRGAQVFASLEASSTFLLRRVVGSPLLPSGTDY